MQQNAHLHTNSLDDVVSVAMLVLGFRTHVVIDAPTAWALAQCARRATEEKKRRKIHRLRMIDFNGQMKCIQFPKPSLRVTYVDFKPWTWKIVIWTLRHWHKQVCEWGKKTKIWCSKKKTTQELSIIHFLFYKKEKIAPKWEHGTRHWYSWLLINVSHSMWNSQGEWRLKSQVLFIFVHKVGFFFLFKSTKRI